MLEPTGRVELLQTWREFGLVSVKPIQFWVNSLFTSLFSGPLFVKIKRGSISFIYFIIYYSF